MLATAIRVLATRVTATSAHRNRVNLIRCKQRWVSRVVGKLGEGNVVAMQTAIPPVSGAQIVSARATAWGSAVAAGDIANLTNAFCVAVG
jgi:hypothetical protein